MLLNSTWRMKYSIDRLPHWLNKLNSITNCKSTHVLYVPVDNNNHSIDLIIGEKSVSLTHHTDSYNYR